LSKHKLVGKELGSPRLVGVKEGMLVGLIVGSKDGLSVKVGEDVVGDCVG